MLRRLPYTIGLVIALMPGATRGDDAWSQLRLGMTPDETTARIGSPILRSSGRGFEVWTYDNGAEALLFGSLIGWTASGPGAVAERSMDVWSANPSHDYAPTFLALLPGAPAPVSTFRQKPDSSGVRRNDVWIPRFVHKS
jgi:hypothetical protein